MVRLDQRRIPFGAAQFLLRLHYRRWSREARLSGGRAEHLLPRVGLQMFIKLKLLGKRDVAG